MAPGVFHIVSIILLINVDHVSTYIQACFFKSDSRLRHNAAAFSVKDIDFTLCTHYIYGYAKVDAERTTIMAADKNAEEGLQGLYSKFNFGKVHNPYVRTILSLDGDDAAFVALQDRDRTFQYFPVHVFAFLRGRGFDGLDIHWEIKNGVTSKFILPKMLQALRTMFQTDHRTEKLLLTITGCGKPALVQANYNPGQIQQYLDYVFVDSQDLVSANYASFIAPLFHNPNITPPFNVNESITYWKSSGVPANKLVMGVPGLGHYVLLKNSSVDEPGSPAESGVVSGPVYNIRDRMAYPEIKYIKNNGLAGIEFTNLDEDDFSGKFCNAGKFPLVTFIKKTLHPPAQKVSRPKQSMKENESNMNIIGNSCFGNLMLIQLLYLFLDVCAV